MFFYYHILFYLFYFHFYPLFISHVFLCVFVCIYINISKYKKSNRFIIIIYISFCCWFVSSWPFLVPEVCLCLSAYICFFLRGFIVWVSEWVSSPSYSILFFFLLICLCVKFLVFISVFPKKNSYVYTYRLFYVCIYI